MRTLRHTLPRRFACPLQQRLAHLGFARAGSDASRDHHPSTTDVDGPPRAKEHRHAHHQSAAARPGLAPSTASTVLCVSKQLAFRFPATIVESRRVQGQPRSFVLAHLGRPETLLARPQQGPAAGARFRSRAHGAVAALWARAQALGLAALIDAHVPRDRRGAPTGQTRESHARRPVS
jgi:hypothetical protein